MKRNRQLKYVVALTTFAFFTVAASALFAQPGLVHTGPDGIYIALGNSVLPAEVEGTRYLSYRIERREGKGEWIELAKVQAPGTQRELDNGLRQIRQRFPEFSDITIDAAEFWRRLQAGREMRSIGNITRLLPVQLLLGVRWLDTTVQRARAYEYRIGRIAESGNDGAVFTTPSIVFPGIPDVARLRTVESDGETVSAHVLWKAGAGTVPSSFRVFRRDGITGPFMELLPNSGDSCCNVTMALMFRADTVLCSLLDKTVEAGTVYQYYAIGRDYFRNEGPPSDTASVITFKMRQVPLPEHMKAMSVDTAGIKIRWELREPSAVHGIVIERAPAIDSGFVELFTAGPRDSMFLDLSVEPMMRYYYRLRLIGPGGLRSIPSAVVIGIFKSSRAPTPPVGVYAEGIDGGVRVHWFPDTTQYLSGYYVFRGEGYGMPLKLITPLLPVTPGMYVDTAVGLEGGRTYMYAVQAVNSSHRASGLSDTSGAMPKIPILVDAPVGLEAVREGQLVRLSWNTVLPRHKDILGYRVYRKGPKDKAFLAVADTLQNPRQNYFTDATVKPGERITYVVRAISVSYDSSAFSNPASAAFPATEYYPPGNVNAVKEGKKIHVTWDEIVQPQAAELHLYRYERGSKATLVKKVKTTTREYLDKVPGKAKRVSYYLVTVGKDGGESRRSEVVTVLLR